MYTHRLPHCPDNQMQRATSGSAGYDIRSPESFTLYRETAYTLPLGFKMAFKAYRVAMIFPRSSLGKAGLRLAQTVGIIDSDYRGEWIAVLENVSAKPIVISAGDRILQAVFLHLGLPSLTDVNAGEWEELCEDSERGEGGFGSTGRE